MERNIDLGRVIGPAGPKGDSRYNDGYAEGSAATDQSSAGALGWQWSNASKLSNSSYSFTLIGSVSNISVGDVLSCKAGYSWDFCGSVSSISGKTITVTLSGAIPTAGTDGVATTWAPENYASNPAGYLWIPSNPDAGNYEIGYGSFSIGYQNKSNEMGAFASGEENIADGRYSSAFGSGNEVGYASVASGKNNKAYGYYSLAHGHSNKIYGGWGMASGSGNETYRLFDFTTGHGNKVYSNGASALGESNAVGNPNKYGPNLDQANNSTVIGQVNNLVKGVASLVVGNRNTVGTDNYGSGQSIIGGSQNTVASTANSHFALVGGSGNTVNGAGNIVGGNGNNVSKDFNIAGGQSNAVSGEGSIVGGKGNTVSAYRQYDLAIGQNNTIEGGTASEKCFGSIAYGNGNKSSNYYNLAGGLNSKASHIGAASLGSHVESSRTYQLNCGLYNAANSDALFVVGNGTNANNRKNALAVLLSGDALFAGGVYSGGKILATQEFVNSLKSAYRYDVTIRSKTGVNFLFASFTVYTNTKWTPTSLSDIKSALTAAGYVNKAMNLTCGEHYNGSESVKLTGIYADRTGITLEGFSYSDHSGYGINVGPGVYSDYTVEAVETAGLFR